MVTEAQKYELEETVKELESYRGRHTELISVLVPAGTILTQVGKQIETEKGTAVNIKSKNTRKSVLDALEMIYRKLKLIQRTPENGLAIYCGNISDVEGQEDIRLWTIEPPKPLRTRAYRCDQTFVIEPLKEMLETDEVYGLLVIDRKEATIGLLEGKSIKVLQHMTSGVPSKVRAGGQCLSPDTLVETKKENKKIKDLEIGEEIKALNIKDNKIIFTKVINKWNNMKETLEILTNKKNKIVCSKEHIIFIKKDNKLIELNADKITKAMQLLNNRLESEIVLTINSKEKLNLIDIETEAKNFFANKILVHNSAQRFHRITEGLAKEFFRRVADTMKDCLFDNKKLKGILVGGPVPTKDEFLETGQLVTALKEKVIAVKDLGNTDASGLRDLVDLSQDILAEQEVTKQKQILDDFFSTLGKQPEKVAYGEAEVKQRLEEGSVAKLILSKTLEREKIKLFEELAKQTSAEIHIVTKDTAEGVQFDNLGGVGAILRFAVA